MQPAPHAGDLNHWVLESSPDCVKVLDVEGCLLGMNRNGQRCMEVDDFKRICGLQWAALWPAESREPIQAALEAARRGQVSHFSAFCPTAKGTPKWWDVMVTPVLDEQGRVEKILSVSRDMTAVHQSQEELRETAARLRFILEAAEVGAWDLDLGHNIAHRSLRHDQCFGYTEPPPEWNFDIFLEHVHPQDRERIRRTFSEALSGQQDWRFECRVIWPDQSVHWISAHGSLYSIEGKPARMLGMISDITGRKRAEAIAEGQKRAFELAVAGAPLPDILDALARAHESGTGETLLASILLLDRDGVHLRYGAGPSLSPDYNQAVDGIRIGEAVGSCGTAAYLGQPVIVQDIATDPRWDNYRHLALPLGLQACWSLPILSSEGKVLGTLASYCRESRNPTPAERESMQLLANTAALVLGWQREIDERKATEAALRASEERFRSLVNATSAIVWTTSVSGEFETPQPGWSEFTGQGFEEIKGRGWLEAVHPDDRVHTITAWNRAVQSGQLYQIEHRLRRADGQYRYMSVRAVPIASPEGRVREWAGSHTDITDRKQAEFHLRQLATHDTLTGLPNRTYLNEHLQELLDFTASNEAIAVMLIDLDRFKQVNDSMGHEAGDVLLREVAQRFKSSLRSGDLVARLGGDEFVVVGHCARGRNTAQDIAEELLKGLDSPISIAGTQVIVGASVGISMYPEHGKTKEELLQHADIAMYRAKNAGANCFRFFLEEMSTEAKNRLALEMSLRGALEHEQFVLHYQPRLDLREMKATAMEALVRWNHPQRGLVLPQEFIPIAEETGLIEALGLWVLRKACAETSALGKSLGQPMRVSVNLSPRQLKSPHLVEQIQLALKEADLRPELLELEITESAFIDDMEASVRTMRTLRALGVQLAVDDFGTGYSGISYLRCFPINTVKLDRSLFYQSEEGVGRYRFIKAIRDMSHALNLTVVAEGVEDIETLNLLKKAACDEVQGFLFSKPLSMKDLRLYLGEQAAA